MVVHIHCWLAAIAGSITGQAVKTQAECYLVSQSNISGFPSFQTKSHDFSSRHSEKKTKILIRFLRKVNKLF